jgi:hypothetical protein
MPPRAAGVSLLQPQCGAYVKFKLEWATPKKCVDLATQNCQSRKLAFEFFA